MTERRRLKVLHVILKVQPTNGQYNEHCLPLLGERDITVCSVLPAELTPPPLLTLFQGDGTLRGGWRALQAALEHESHDVVHVHAPQTGALLLAMSAVRRRSLANVVYTVQNSYASYRRRNRALMVAIFACYPRLVFCSEAARASMSLLLRRLARSKSFVVPNCVDLAAVDRVVQGRAVGGADGVRIVSAGRLVAIKDPRLIVDAFARCRHEGMELVFVGDGALRPELEAEARRRGLGPQVRFTGMLPRGEVYRQVAEADIYVSASRGEGLPVAVLEAMACGCPVVLSDIPPHRELAAGVDAIPLVPPGDAEGFARAIGGVAAMTPGQRAEVGARCRRVVHERYSLGVMHEAYRPVYQQASAGGRFA